MVDVILTDVPTPDAGSASGLLSTIQQVGMALGVALLGVVFFGQLAHNAGNAVDAVVPSVRQQLSVLNMPEAAQDNVISDFRACVQDRSAATDPTAIPPSCRTAAPAVAERLGPILTTAGLQANAKNFAHTFVITLWLLIAVSAGIFALPNRIAQPPSIAGVVLGADTAR
jgi:hypothetical protein